jgi:DNA-binding MarR family transcriptional regulator
MSDNFDDMKDLVEVDRIIHEPARLLIMAMLYPVESADFLFLLRETGLTKGNLSTHLYRLEQAGYLEIEKTFRGRVPQTNYRLTENGRTAYANYREHLKRMVQAMDKEDK